METILLEKDLPVFYVTAESFPNGIQSAFDTLHKLISFEDTKNYFGISRPEHGKIVYRAAAEVKEEGMATVQLEKLILQKGKYVATTIHNFKKDVSAIEKTFSILLSSEDISPDGYCVEWYINNMEDVICMIRLKDPGQSGS